MESKWHRLSPRALDMLQAENDPRSVGHAPKQVHAHLEQLGWLRRCYEAGQIDAAPPDDDGTFHDYLRQNVGQWQSQDKVEPVYYAAAGLVAFGHKDYFDVMLRTMPRHAGTGWPAPLWAAKYFRSLMFELPFCPVDETAEALDWWHQKSGDLQWSEEQGAYTRV